MTGGLPVGRAETDVRTYGPPWSSWSRWRLDLSAVARQ